MKRIGVVLHTSSSKSIILKAENIPRIGDKVVDEDLRQVGTVFDVFGPVSSPYVAVRPSVEETNGMTNLVLYALPSFKLRRRKRNR